MSTPLGISQLYDSQKGVSYITFSYEDDPSDEYFQIEYYDETLRRWMPFDGRNGIVPKTPPVGSNR
jgi:hypothetical protein